MIRWQRGLWAGVLGMTLSSTLHAAATVNAPATSVGGMADMGAGQMTPAQSAQLALDLATSMERIEKYPDAIAQYERALAYDAGNPQAIRRLAVLYSKTGQFDRADVYFQKAAHAQPHNANVFNDWGRSYYLRGNWTMAEKKFRDALQTEPRHRLALNNLALTLGQEKRYSEAFQIFRNGGLSDAQAHCNMAYILSSQGRVEEARSACQLAKRLDANCVKADELLTQLGSSEHTAIEKVTFETPASAPAATPTHSEPATVVAPPTPADTTPKPVCQTQDGRKWYPK